MLGNLKYDLMIYLFSENANTNKNNMYYDCICRTITDKRIILTTLNIQRKTANMKCMVCTRKYIGECKKKVLQILRLNRQRVVLMKTNHKTKEYMLHTETVTRFANSRVHILEK